MSSLYFTSSKNGYVQSVIEGIPNMATGRQIPVSFRVNEYMHNPPKQEEKDAIQEVDEETEHFQTQKSARSFEASMQKAINCSLVKSAHQLQKNEDDHQNEDEMSSSLIKQKEYSSKDTSASQIDSNQRKKIKVSIIESEFEKNEDYEEEYSRSNLQGQLAKEKALRKNLENSYMNLLEKIRYEKFGKIIDKQIQKQVYRKERPKSMFHPKDQIPARQKEKRFKNQRKHSQCSEKSKRSEEEEVKSNPQEKAPDYSLENIYEEHLKGQKYFQRSLIQSIKLANLRIEGLESSLVKRQIQLEKLIREGENRQCINKEYYNEQSSKNSQKRQSWQGIKQQFHYIFTIFIMFLVIVVISKNKER